MMGKRGTDYSSKWRRESEMSEGCRMRCIGNNEEYTSRMNEE